MTINPTGPDPKLYPPVKQEYEYLRVRVPKGQKAEVEQIAAARGMTVSEYILDLLAMGRCIEIERRVEEARKRANVL